MTPSPSAAQVLVDMGKLGIDVQAQGDVIRFRPRSAMTPALLERLQANKAELMRLLNTETAIAELRRSMERYWKDPAWVSAWELRFKSAQWADFASLRRVVGDALEQAETHHRNRDWCAFVSSCRYVQRLARGELWDETDRANEKCSDLTAATI
jgi:hypothetical protein